MKKYLAIYLANPAAGDNETVNFSTEMRQQGMQAWGRWMEQNSHMIVDSGGPLGKTKRASLDGISDYVNTLTGYVIVKAESHQQAAQMFKNHPHFSIFPGDSVEIMECLEIPSV